MADGSKVVVCPKSLVDALDDYAWQTDPELAELTANRTLTIGFIEYLIDYAKQLRQYQPQFAIKTCDGKHIGNCAYFGINKTKGEAEIGIVIGDRHYWDRGYGTDAVKALADYIFSQLGFKRIHLKTLASNKRAQRCFGKCGFRVYGNKNSGAHSFLLMEMHRDWWRQSRNNNKEQKL
jgi:RimJ/RimL family protein N-acetyltransferase